MGRRADGSENCKGCCTPTMTVASARAGDVAATAVGGGLRNPLARPGSWEAPLRKSCRVTVSSTRASTGAAVGWVMPIGCGRAVGGAFEIE